MAGLRLKVRLFGCKFKVDSQGLPGFSRGAPRSPQGVIENKRKDKESRRGVPPTKNPKEGVLKQLEGVRRGNQMYGRR